MIINTYENGTQSTDNNLNTDDTWYLQDGSNVNFIDYVTDTGYCIPVFHLIDRGTPYHPAHGMQGLNCITDYVQFYTILHRRLLKRHVFIAKVLYYIKCFMVLKTFRNLRFK